jgi:hypothetical protein
MMIFFGGGLFARGLWFCFEEGGEREREGEGARARAGFFFLVFVSAGERQRAASVVLLVGFPLFVTHSKKTRRCISQKNSR